VNLQESVINEQKKLEKIMQMLGYMAKQQFPKKIQKNGWTQINAKIVFCQHLI